MCGIAGVCGRVEQGDVAKVVSMMEAIKHRGPDGSGLLALGSNTPSLNRVSRGLVSAIPFKVNLTEPCSIMGHVRLAILDLSDAGLQPLPSPDSRVWIVLNGEIYNYIELRRELADLGYPFQTQTDTEVLLAAYLHWGRDMLARLDGMFAFAISDARTRVLFCARDRFGEKPFFYRLSPDAFWFASEMRAVLVAGQSPKANLSSVASYLVMGLSSFGEETVFSGVKQLLPSSYLEVPWDAPDKYKLSPYYKGLEELDELAEEDPSIDMIAMFREYLTHSVKLRMRADVPVGTCLSGGLDSSAVTSLALRELNDSGSKFHAFTAIPDIPGYSELAWAKQVVEGKNAILHEVHVTAIELKKDLDNFIQDEPIPSLSVYLQYRVMRAAREQGIPVLLDGQGGDETLLGYERIYAIYILQSLLGGNVQRASQAFDNFTKKSTITSRRLMELVAYSHPLVRRVWRSWKRSRWLIPEVRLRVNHKDLQQVNILDAQRYELQSHPLPDLLRSEDRNAMSFAVETRLPFLDHKLVEFCLQAPVELKLHKGWTKWMLRKALDGIMPSSIAWRRDKRGYEAPDKVWMNALSREVQEVLNDSPLTAALYVDRDPWKLVSRSLLIEDPKLAWRIFCLEKWMRLHQISL